MTYLTITYVYVVLHSPRGFSRWTSKEKNNNEFLVSGISV